MIKSICEDCVHSDSCVNKKPYEELLKKAFELYNSLEFVGSGVSVYVCCDDKPIKGEK